ncbi:MAG: hypothetical protein LBK92_02325 [Endomicrobium sp.]|jgi:hypothetical protein|nr:hypothetical protein [Endomicrobium sp.]
MIKKELIKDLITAVLLSAGDYNAWDRRQYRYLRDKYYVPEDDNEKE